MILYLVLNDQLLYPALFISGFINNHKSDYYSSLMDVTTKRKWEDYIVFMLKAVEVQAAKTSEIIEKLHDFIDEREKRLSSIDSLKGQYIVILKNMLSSKIFISMKEVEEKLGISKNTVTKIFSLLVEN